MTIIGPKHRCATEYGYGDYYIKDSVQYDYAVVKFKIPISERDTSESPASTGPCVCLHEMGLILIFRGK